MSNKNKCNYKIGSGCIISKSVADPNSKLQTIIRETTQREENNANAETSTRKFYRGGE
jgi:hypothetical protein